LIAVRGDELIEHGARLSTTHRMVSAMDRLSQTEQ